MLPAGARAIEAHERGHGPPQLAPHLPEFAAADVPRLGCLGPTQSQSGTSCWDKVPQAACGESACRMGQPSPPSYEESAHPRPRADRDAGQLSNKGVEQLDGQRRRGTAP